METKIIHITKENIEATAKEAAAFGAFDPGIILS